MSHLALVDQLLEERYGKPDTTVTPLATHAPPVRAFGPAAICHTKHCPNQSSLVIEVPFRGRRQACGIHIDDALDALGVTGTTDARITRISP